MLAETLEVIPNKMIVAAIVQFVVQDSERRAESERYMLRDRLCRWLKS